MAAVAYSTDNVVAGLLARQYEAAGFLVESVRAGGHTVTHARPTGTALDQFVAVSGERAVLSTAPLSYGQKVGGPALLALLAARSVEDVRRRDLIGEGAVIFLEPDGVRVLTEVSGATRIYYSEAGGSVSFSSVLYFLACSLPSVSLDEVTLIEQSFQYSVLGDQTLFRECRCLTRGDSLWIPARPLPGAVRVTRDVLALTPAQRVPLDAAVDRLYEITTDTYREVARSTELFEVSMTGGLDSRLQLALLLGSGVDRKNIKLVYGSGNSHLTNTRKRDRELVQLIAQGEGLAFEEMDWTDNGTSAEQWNSALAVAGEAALLMGYAGNSKITRHYAEVAAAGQFAVFGYFGELLRPLDWQYRVAAEVTVATLLERYLYLGRGGLLLDLYESLTDRLAARMSAILGVGLDSPLTESQIARVYMEYRRSADTVMSTFCGLFGPSFPALGRQQALEAILGLDFADKARSQLMIEMMKRAAPHLLRYPVFSHGEDYRLDVRRARVSPPPARAARMAVSGWLAKGLPHLHKAVRQGYLDLSNWRNPVAAQVDDTRSLANRLVAEVQEAAGVDLIDPAQHEGYPIGLLNYAQNLYIYTQAKASRTA